MAYGDSVDPKSRVVSIVLVGIITFLLGWLLVSGLAIEVAKKAIQKLDVVDIQEPPPPEEPPPPPPADIPPPPQTRIETPPVSIAPPTTNNVVAPPPPNPPAPPPVVIPPVVTPPAPPARDDSRPARPRGNESSWVTTDDYPSSALREEAQGVTAVRLGVGPDGRVTSCDVTSSSGNASLDQAACRNLQRRARFEPALDREGNPTSGSFTKRVRWQIPER